MSGGIEVGPMALRRLEPSVDELGQGIPPEVEHLMWVDSPLRTVSKASSTLVESSAEVSRNSRPLFSAGKEAHISRGSWQH